MSLDSWLEQWQSIANFKDAEMVNVAERISRAVTLAGAPVDAAWPRPNPEDHKWRDAPYRRGDRGHPSTPERALEHQLLGDGPVIRPGATSLGGRVADGVNALALTNTPKVEADVLLLVNNGERYELHLVEAKVAANNAWYAVLELLQQMLLFSASPHASELFHRRRDESLGQLSLTGIVLAPPAFYTSPGKKSQSVRPAQQLVQALRPHARIVLATWDHTSRAIKALGETKGPTVA